MPFSFSSLIPWSTPSEGGPDYIPLADTPKPKSRRRHERLSFTALVLAALVGIFIIYLAFLFFHHRSEYDDSLRISNNESTFTSASEGDNLSLAQLRDIVARSKGYWARDYSLNLGWNNMRYIIETALLHGALLNRTVILPSFVYARSCEYDVSVCANFAHMVNHGDAVHSDEWRNLPIDEQMSWRLPISIMLNMTLLRQTQPVITVSEFLRLHNLSEATEASDGHWDRVRYHENPYIFEHTSRTPSLHIIEEKWYDPREVNRVDVIPTDMKRRGGWSTEGGNSSKGEVGKWQDISKTALYSMLEAALPEWPKVLDWDQARQMLQQRGYTHEAETDQRIEQVLNENGWEVLYTYNGARNIEFMKSVVFPIRQVTPRQTLRGLQEDFGHLDADVVLLAGEVHNNRKPGSLRFTTAAQRSSFSRLVLYHVHAPYKVYELAAVLATRMKEKNEGRMWLAAHMRRGDFLRTPWIDVGSIEDHLGRIQRYLAKGRDVLRSLHEDELTTYDIPDVVPNRTAITHFQPTLDTDKFYIATDERDPGNLAYLTAHGAVLILDLLTIEDRRAFGWPLMLTDVLGLVEQALLAQSSFFYANAFSSYAGCVVNLRAVGGLDPRTTVIY